MPERFWPDLIMELYRAYWVRGDDFTATETLATALTAVSIEERWAQRALAANEDQGIKQKLRERTDEAIAREASSVHPPCSSATASR